MEKLKKLAGKNLHEQHQAVLRITVCSLKLLQPWLSSAGSLHYLLFSLTFGRWHPDDKKEKKNLKKGEKRMMIVAIFVRETEIHGLVLIFVT